VIYSMMREQIIGRTNCGGAHRMWDFMLSQNGTGIFSHIRVRKVYKTCFQLDQFITNCVKVNLAKTNSLNSMRIAHTMLHLSRDCDINFRKGFISRTSTGSLKFPIPLILPSSLLVGVRMAE